MGRGIGDVQRRILDALPERDDVSVRALTERLFGEGFTDVQRRSVARAVVGLERRGLVSSWMRAERFRTRSEIRHGWIDPVEADLPPETAEERYYAAVLGKYPITYTSEIRVPIPEMFVRRPGGGLPADAIAADRALSG